MANLLVRDIDEGTKRALAVRAAQNGRSQQAEALIILKTALQPQQKTWIQMMRDDAQAVGGIEFELPKRHAPRFTGMQA